MIYELASLLGVKSPKGWYISKLVTGAGSSDTNILSR
jgi:hypothetical protein